MCNSYRDKRSRSQHVRIAQNRLLNVMTCLSAPPETHRQWTSKTPKSCASSSQTAATVTFTWIRQLVRLTETNRLARKTINCNFSHKKNQFRIRRQPRHARKSSCTKILRLKLGKVSMDPSTSSFTMESSERVSVYLRRQLTNQNVLNTLKMKRRPC